MPKSITRDMRELAREYFIVLEQCANEEERQAVAMTFIDAAKNKKKSIFNTPVEDSTKQQ